MKNFIAAFVLSSLAGMSLFARNDTIQYEQRSFQFTFLFPPLSTNGLNNVNIVNDVSLNLFVGLSGGVDLFEAGGFINIDRYHVRGAQLAGFGNTVGGSMNGAQLSGFYNVTGGRVHGFQGAGFANVTGSDVKGVQAAGFANVAADTLDGLQAAGFVNFAGASRHGVQVAGFGNVAGGGKNLLQGAGFFNIAREVNGAQLAGFINVADHVVGTQVAGFINICDSIEGVPLSFISVVKKNGYRKLGFSISEVQYASFSYKMGVKHLYNIYSFGKPFGPGSRWMYGGGVGTELDLSENLLLNIEGTVHQELWIGNPAASHFLQVDRLNLYNSVKFLFGWNVDEQVTLSLGPTYNVAVANSNSGFGQLPWNNIAPYSIFNHTAGNYRQTNVQMWFGLQGSIHF